MEAITHNLQLLVYMLDVQDLEIEHSHEESLTPL